MNTDPDINSLHNNIQDCFKFLDERIYKAVNHQPLSRTIIVEKDNTHLLKECEELRRQVKQIQLQYDQLCVKWMDFQKQYANLKQQNEIQKQEIETQSEIIKKKKMQSIQQINYYNPESSFNIFRSLKAYINNNESQFSLFLSTILHSKNQEKHIDLHELLCQIERYYRPQKLNYNQYKFQINSVERVKLPQINRVQHNRIQKIHYKIKSALENYENNDTITLSQDDAQKSRDIRSISFQ